MSISENNLCVPLKEKKCSEEFPYLLIETNECIQNCSISNLFNKECIIDNPSENLNSHILSNIRNGLFSNELGALLDKVINDGEDLLIEDENSKYQLTSTSNQISNEYNNISTINLGKCENILRNYYNLSENESLIIFKVDLYIEGLISPLVVYEVYHPRTKIRLDLIHCQDIQIKIYLPASIDENELFKHDPSNNFYNDISLLIPLIIGLI